MVGRISTSRRGPPPEAPPVPVGWSRRCPGSDDPGPRTTNNERDEQLRELSLHDVHLLLWFWRQQVSEKLESEVRITHSPSKEDLPKAYSAVLPRWEELRQQAVAEAELVAVSKFFDDDPESVFDGEALDIELNEHADSI